MLVVSHISGNIICATFLYIMIDSSAQLVMIDKGLAQELGLTTIDLEPYLFTIVTLVDDMV